MNLDSYSLYTRMGFVPYAFFQDVVVTTQDHEPPIENATASQIRSRARRASPEDIPALLELESRLLGISRSADFYHFISDPLGIWHTLVVDDPAGELLGYLVSIDQPACRIIGPGASVHEAAMIALLAAQLGYRKNRSMLVIAPADRPAVIQQLYSWGGRNCETHVAQCRPVPGTDRLPKLSGVYLPTFLPETF